MISNPMLMVEAGFGERESESLVHTITLKVFGYHREGEKQADDQPRRKAKPTKPAPDSETGQGGYKDDDCQIIKKLWYKMVTV